jgi:hypothetical protein
LSKAINADEITAVRAFSISWEESVVITLAELKSASGLQASTPRTLVEQAPVSPLQTAPAKIIQVASALPAHIEHAGRLMSICTILATIEDIARPIAPFPMYSFVGALVLFLLSFRTGKLFAFLALDLTRLRSFAAVVATVSAGLIALEGADPSIAQHGVLASKIPAAAEVQKVLLGIDKHLASIETNTKKTVDKIEELQTSVKKETSLDPRKELANLGVMWSQESIDQAERTQDVRSIELLLAGGMRPSRYQEFEKFVQLRFNPEIANLYLSYKVFDALACPAVKSYSMSFYYDALQNVAKKAFTEKVCGSLLTRPVIEAIVADLEQTLKNTRAKIARSPKPPADCVRFAQRGGLDPPPSMCWDYPGPYSDEQDLRAVEQAKAVAKEFVH